ncbi:MAG: GGDEF domain-containing protein [Myxococcota bacterium]
MGSIEGDITEGELGQAHLRYRAGAPVLLLYALAHLSGWFGDLRVAVAFVGAYVAFGVGWTAVVRAELGSERARRHLVIIGDELLVAGCLYADPPALAPLVFMPIFMTLGNGLRFGVGMALYSAVVATIAIGTVFVVSPYWSAIPTVSFGILAGTLVVPVYGVGLNARLQRRRRAAEARAARLEVEVRTDPLTGLANRLALHHALRRALDDATRFAASWVVLYVDLDGFKAVNDTLGHDAGDAVLIQVADALRTAVRGGDTVARLGGDEFAIVAQGVRDVSDATRIARNVLESARRVRIAGHPELRLAASVGGCLVRPDEHLSAEDVVRAADEAMLEAKRSGKGRFVIDGVTAYTPEPSPPRGARAGAAEAG